MSKTPLVVLAAAILLVFLLRVEREINPVVNPMGPIPEYTGALALNDKLDPSKATIYAANVHGPEDVAFHPSGSFFYTGSDDGWIYTVDAADPTLPATKWVYTAGRPLGMVFDSTSNRLVVADIALGLVAVDASTKEVFLLASTAEDGKPIYFADDVVVSKEGLIYFTDATVRPTRTVEDVKVNTILEVSEGRGTGRVLCFNPKTRVATVVTSGLVFANGITLSRNEDFLFVGELGRFRVWKVWLKGPKAGTREVFGDGNMVGFPDGMQTDPEDGSLWVAIYGPRDAALQLMLSHAWIPKYLSQLPQHFLVLLSSPKPHSLLLHYAEDGTLLESFHGTHKTSQPITSVNRRGNKLFLGTLLTNGISVFTL